MRELHNCGWGVGSLNSYSITYEGEGGLAKLLQHFIEVVPQMITMYRDFGGSTQGILSQQI